MTKTLAVRLVISLIGLFFHQMLAAFDLSEDVAGASDYAGINRYPGAKIEQYSSSQQVNYALVLGKLKRVNNELAPEYVKHLNGRLTRITYRIPEGYSSLAAFQYYASQLASAELLFNCAARECGSSSYWANEIFKISILYGPDHDQHYSVFRIKLDDKELLVVLYSIMRGNKRVYVHLDLLETKLNRTQDLSINPDALLKSLRQNKHLSLVELVFNEQDELEQESVASLNTLVKALNKNIRLKLYVVGHLNSTGTLDTLVARSLKRAVSVKRALTSLGIEEARLEARGIGPLAPMGNAAKEPSRIELVLQGD